MPRILQEVKVLEQETKQFKLNLTKLCWLMRGGVTYDEMYYTGPEEREVMSKMVEENFEVTKKSGLPYF